MKILCLYLAILFFLLVGAVNLPFVHRGLTSKANSILHEKGLPLHIGKVTLLISGKIGIEQAEIIADGKDTIVYAGMVNIAVRPVPLLFKRVVIKDITMHDGVVNLLTDSITGKITLLSYLPVSGKSQDKKQKKKNPWDINADAIHLKNIRFSYNSPKNGILIKQYLFKADLLLDKFSLLQKLISVSYLRLEKANGKIYLTKTEKTEKNESPASTPFAWKISLINLQLTEILISINQRSGLGNTEIVSKFGKLSGKDLALVSNTLLVSKLKLEDPDILINSSGKISPGFRSTEQVNSNSPKIPWSIDCSAINIKNGSFSMNREQADTNDVLARLLPVQNFNTIIRDFKFSPEVTGFDISSISFALNDQNVLQSGKILFQTDTLRSVKLSVQLAATLNNQKLSGFSRNDTILLSANLSGSLDSLQIEKLQVHAPSGIDLLLSGSIIDPLKITASQCSLDFRTGTVTHNQTIELIRLFGPDLKLPDFKTVTLSGNIRDSIMSPGFDLTLKSPSGNIQLEGNLDLINKYGNLTAYLNQLRLGELLGIADLDGLTGSLSVKAGWENVKELAGEGNVEIDTILYKNVTTSNINISLSLNKNECLFNIMASDSSLMCGLNGLFGWENNSYHGNLSGNFNIDEGRLHLVPFQLQTKGELAASINKSANILEASLDLKNFFVTNGNKNATVKNTSLALTMADSLVKTQLISDFITADFQSRASLTELKKAITTSLSTKIISKDSIEIFNPDAISLVPDIYLNMKVQYDSLFGMFIPDTILNFNRINLLADKKNKDSLLVAEVTADRLKFKSINGFNIIMKIKDEDDRISCNIDLDSIRTGGILTGASNIGLDILRKKIVGRVLIKDPKGNPFYQLSAEVIKRNDNIVFKTSVPQWTLKANIWTISAGEILTIEKSPRDMVADLHLQHEQMKLDLYGRKSDGLQVDIQNVLLSMFVPPELIPNKPDGIVSANVTYRDDGRKNLDFKFDIRQIKWADIMLRRVEVTGNLMADSSGIKQTNITAMINDSSKVALDFGLESGNSGILLHSTFSDLPLHIAEPLISKYANQLHGSTSGDITLSRFKNKLSMDGEIRVKEAAFRVVPLNARFSFPDELIVIKENQVNFNQFIVRDSMMKQLYVNGTINLNDSKNITADLRITSDNLQVMNTSMKDNPVFFGTIFINSGIDITGPLSNPSIKGNLALESGTDITYRYKGDETVSETQKVITFARLDGNQLLVNDITARKSQLTKMPSVQTSIEINPKSVFNFEISSSFDVGVKISGSGFLNYAMLPNNTMSLSGTYEIQQGTSELKMVGWPRKFFTIVPGSSVRWNGSINDPEINLEATSRVRSSYENPIDNKNRDVDFFVSMKISNQLSNVSIVFDVKSPDQYISSVLATLSPEERMMQAVNLLLFEGIDLPDIKSTNNYLTSQINGFWENQLNSMTKSNVKKVNLSFGIDSYTETSASGEQDYTSLTYEVEKKLFRNRGSVKVSGRVSDVKQPGQTSNTMIENFSFEYALDSLNSRYLKLYRKQDYEDILEGEVIKSGVGYIYRKTYDSVKDIWRRKEKITVGQKQIPSGKQK